MTEIFYGKTQDASLCLMPLLKNIINENKFVDICDIGGGANPFFSEKYIKEKHLNYSILDISKSELEKAPTQYNKIVADVASENFDAKEKYDLVFSRMLAEHIKGAQQFHTNLYDSLKQGGLSVHFFPTLFAFPFFVNLCIPESLSNFLLNYFAPRDNYQRAKFPAYYQWCYGPTKKQLNRLKEIGFQVESYYAYFGHHAYYNKIKPLKALHNIKTDLLLKYPTPYLTSYAIIVLRKPLD